MHCLNVCSSGGVELFNSMEDCIKLIEIEGRDADKASHISQTSNIIEINEIRDPIEDTTFHVVKASG